MFSRTGINVRRSSKLSEAKRRSDQRRLGRRTPYWPSRLRSWQWRGVQGGMQHRHATLGEVDVEATIQ